MSTHATQDILRELNLLCLTVALAHLVATLEQVLVLRGNF